MSTIKNGFDRSRIMRRAWFLVNNQSFSFAYAMQTAWKEAKEYKAEKAAEAAFKAEYEPNGQQDWVTSPLATSAETMAEYYQSNIYKGD